MVSKARGSRKVHQRFATQPQQRHYNNRQDPKSNGFPSWKQPSNNNNFGRNNNHNRSRKHWGIPDSWNPR